MRDFKQQLEAYGEELKNTRCPYSDVELDREIRHAVWDTRRGVPPCTPANVPPAVASTKRWLWLSVAVAACLLAVLLPLGRKAHANDGIHTVDVDGQQIYFACNNGCSADATIETFKTLLR